MGLPDNLLHNDEDDEKDFEVTPQLLSKRMRYLNRMLDHFWTRWKSEYLLELRDAHRFHSEGTTGQRIAVGDVVVIHSDEKKRGFWNLGKVEEKVKGQDEQVRGAVVRVYTGQRKSKLIGRPVQRLYPLELRVQSNQREDHESSAEELNTNQESGENAQTKMHAVESGDESVVNEQPRELRRSARTASVKAKDGIFAQSIN